MLKKIAGVILAALLCAGMLAGCAEERPSSSEQEPQGEITGPVFIPYIEMRARTIPNLDMEEGREGRFTVGEYTAKLYSASGIADKQKIVDDLDSAWYFDNFSSLSDIIGDHNYQGFEIIYDSIPGETIAYLTVGKTTVSYICVSVYRNCLNDNGMILLEDGRVLQTDPGDGELATYTCNDYTGRSITVVFWDPMAVSIRR